MKANMKKILLVIPLLSSYCSKGMEDPNANIDPTVESVRPGYLINELGASTDILERECEVAVVLSKRKQAEEHGNQSKKARKKTRKKEASTPVKGLYCNVEGCQKKCQTESGLRMHKNRIHGFKIVCGIGGCPYKTGSTSDLKKHKDRHEKQKDLTCDTCDYRCALQSDLNRHKEMHNTEKSVECDVEGCQEKFKTKASLYSHKTRAHGFQIACGIDGCQYKTGSISDLKRHKDRHEKQKDLTCDTCDYRCALQSDLNRHMQTHNTEKLYECDVEGCQKKCKTASALNSHKNRDHRPKKVCGINECPYKTGSTSDLNKHKKRIHTKQQDYVCDIGECQYKTGLASDLTRHKKRIHGIQKD